VPSAMRNGPVCSGSFARAGRPGRGRLRNVSKELIGGRDRTADPPGPISYARSLPRDKAIQREVLIAYQMNGRDSR